MNDSSTISILPPVTGEASHVESSQHPKAGGNSISCLKVKVPDSMAEKLNALYPIALRDARLTLQDRSKSSSKHWPELPCAVSKSLITNYSPTKKGPHPVEFPAKAIMNGKPVTLTEQASWTMEDGAIYRTDEGDLVSQRKVQLLRE